MSGARIFGLVALGVLILAAYVPSDSPLYPVVGFALVVLVLTIVWSVLFTSPRRKR